MIALHKQKRTIIIIAALAVIVLFFGIALMYFKPGKQSNITRGSLVCNGQIDDPSQRLKCNLKKIDAAGGLPKHLDDNALDAVVSNMQLLGQLRLALRQNQITEAEYDSRYEVLQSGCKSYSGLSCSEILMLQVPD